jgi:hypothetical protein
MTISFELPESIEQYLRDLVGDLDAVAKEAALVELYRQSKLTHHQLATALGLERFETDGLLKRHGVTEDLITLEEFDEQVAGLRQRLGK